MSSLINDLVLSALVEQVGYHGVEMYNEKYPYSQQDSGHLTSPRSQGDPNLAFGGNNRFDKDSTSAGAKAGDPNLSFGGDRSFARNDSLGTRSGSVLKYR